ncbi:hypothetical protein C8J57DRAFT_1346517 [Mycena rebaudengoi]|nr:hypothetical protein C8J57DRAFT_1484520 [Mycena rebaudengoi]KAJ7216835.1 hypothetical protein C8J57DRAFT_1483007 [Mycena rebaudengoi]KAJ7248093.1 hypothetical protein C8J57DRAFT_1358708 [Mycena rebaudengoi]KAJ7254732.1 hypothetical protein C8J57DRAFT_1346517 [Mycena rebaudengoi]
MYMRTLSLFTLLAVLSVVNGQKEEWLCNCTTKGQNNATTTRQCCAKAPGAFVPGPPPQCDLVGSPLVGPAQNFIDCCVKSQGGFCCVPVNGTAV